MGETVAVNRKARHEYSIEDTLEAGLVLTGTEIKSIREGKANLQDAYARIEHGEAWLVGATSRPGRVATATTMRRAGTASCCCTACRSINSSARPAPRASH